MIDLSLAVWSYNPAHPKSLKQLTDHTEEDAKYLSYTLGASALAYSQGGRLHLLPLGGTASPLSLKLTSDYRHSRPGFKSGPVVGVSISPTGVRAALNTRGEVLVSNMTNCGFKTRNSVIKTRNCAFKTRNLVFESDEFCRPSRSSTALSATSPTHQA